MSGRTMSRGGQTKRPLSHTPSLQLSVAGSSGAAQHWQGQPQRFQRPPPSSSGTLAPRGGSMPGPPHHLPPPRGTPAHYPPYGRPHGPGYPQQHTPGGQFGGPRPAAPPFGPPRPPQRAPPLPMPKPFDDNDDLFDQALAAVVDPIPVKKHAASTTPEPPVVPPGQQAAPVPSSSSVPPDHSTRLYPALGSLSESVAASPPPPSEPSTQQLGENLHLRRELERLRGLLNDRESRISALTRRVQNAEAETADLRVSHVAVREEARSEVKRAQEESMRGVTQLQSMLGFKMQELMEADNRKKALEAKLERYRLKLSQYQAEMGGDRAAVPSTHPGEYDIAHGTQPSQPSQRAAAVKATPSQRSTGVQRSTPQHELVVEASPVPGPALAAPPPLAGPKEAVTPRIPTPPVTAPPQLPPPAPVGLSDTITPQMQGSGSSSFPSSRSSLLSSEPWAGLGVRVLDALFLRGSSDLRALMQHEGGRCWSGFVDGCPRCGGGEHAHAPCPSLSDCLHDVISTANDGPLPGLSFLLSCLATFAGLDLLTEHPSLAPSSSSGTSQGVHPPASHSTQVGPVCPLHTVCGVCDPVKLASLSLLLFLLEACPALLCPSSSPPLPSSSSAALALSSIPVSSATSPYDSLRASIRPSASKSIEGSQHPHLTKVFQSLSLRHRTRAAAYGVVDVPLIGPPPKIDINQAAITALSCCCQGFSRLEDGTRHEARVGPLSRRCNLLCQLLSLSLDAATPHSSSPSTSLPTDISTLFTKNCLSSAFAALSSFLQEWCASPLPPPPPHSTHCLLDATDFAVSLMGFTTRFLFWLPAASFPPLLPSLSLTLLSCAGCLPSLPTPSSLRPSTSLTFTDVLQEADALLRVHRAVFQLLAGLIGAQGTAGVACVWPPHPLPEAEGVCMACSALHGTHTCSLRESPPSLLPACVHALDRVCVLGSELSLSLAHTPLCAHPLWPSLSSCLAHGVSALSTVCVGASSCSPPSSALSLLGGTCVAGALACVGARVGKEASEVGKDTHWGDTHLYVSHLQKLAAELGARHTNSQ